MHDGAHMSFSNLTFLVNDHAVKARCNKTETPHTLEPTLGRAQIKQRLKVLTKSCFGGFAPLKTAQN